MGKYTDVTLHEPTSFRPLYEFKRQGLYGLSDRYLAALEEVRGDLDSLCDNTLIDESITSVGFKFIASSEKQGLLRGSLLDGVSILEAHETREGALEYFKNLYGRTLDLFTAHTENDYIGLHIELHGAYDSVTQTVKANMSKKPIILPPKNGLF